MVTNKAINHRLIEVIQIKLFHSRSAFGFWVKMLADMNTAIVLIQEYWSHCDIKRLDGCGKLFIAKPSDKTRACFLAKGMARFIQNSVAIRLHRTTTSSGCESSCTHGKGEPVAPTPCDGSSSHRVSRWCKRTREAS